MATTKRDAAISAANTLISLCSTLKSMRQQLVDFVTQYNSEGYSTTWAALATAALNADGSLGTADGSPVVTNPINNGLAGQTALTKAVSKNQLVSGVVVLQQLQNFFGNVAVTTGNYNQNIDDLAS